MGSLGENHNDMGPTIKEPVHLLGNCLLTPVEKQENGARQ